jgi:hypothetical protein
MKTVNCFGFWVFLVLLPSSLFLSSLFPPRDARGAEFKLIPSLSLQEEYNDNINYTATEKVDDFITTVTPGLELVTRTEKVDLNLLARVPVLRYIDTTDLNHVDQNYLGKLRYSPDPNWTLSGEAGYVEDSRPDRDLAVTGLLTKAVIRRRQNYGAGIDHNFSEKTKVGLAYSYSEEKYPDPEFADLKEHDARMTYIQDLGRYLPNIAGRLNLGYSRYEYENPIIDYFYGTIGMSWALEEKWSFILDGGASYTLSQSGPDNNKQRDSGTGWVGMASFVYKGEKTEGDLTFSHRVEPASGTVGVTNRTSASVGIYHRFTYEFSGGLSGGYFFNKAEEGKFSTVAFDERFFYLQPRLRYEFNRDVALEASYNFAYTRDKISHTEPRRSLAMLRFYIQHAFFE